MQSRWHHATFWLRWLHIRCMIWPLWCRDRQKFYILLFQSINSSELHCRSSVNASEKDVGTFQGKTRLVWRGTLMFVMPCVSSFESMWALTAEGIISIPSGLSSTKIWSTGVQLSTEAEKYPNVGLCTRTHHACLVLRYLRLTIECKGIPSSGNGHSFEGKHSGRLNWCFGLQCSINCEDTQEF